MLHWYRDETYLSGTGIEDIRNGKKIILWSFDQTGVNKRLAQLYQELDKEQIECIFSPEESEWGTIQDDIPVCRPTAGKDAVIVSTMYDWKIVTEQAAALGYETVYFFLLDEGKEKIELYRNTFLEVQDINVILADKTYKYLHFIPDEKHFIGLFRLLECGMNIEDHFFVIYAMHRTAELATFGTWDLYKSVMRKHRNLYLLSDIRPMCFNNWDENKENMDKLVENADKIFFHSVHPPRDLVLDYWSSKRDCVRKKGVLIPWDISGEHKGTQKKYMEDVIQYVRMVVMEEIGQKYFCKLYPTMQNAIFHVNNTDYVVPIEKKFHREKNRNILVGHSAWAATMAADTIEYLSDLDESFTIYCITSYGDKKKEIEETGARLFGDRFVSVENFMEYEEYAEFLSKIDVAVFGMEQQIGRTCMELLFQLGVKVYLKPGLQAWEWACSDGFHVYDYYSIRNETLEQILDNPYERQNASLVEKGPDLEEKAKKWKEMIEFDFDKAQ